MAGRQTSESPTGQPFDVGYLGRVGIVLGKTVSSSGDLNPERMFVLCHLGPPQIRKSHGAPFREDPEKACWTLFMRKEQEEEKGEAMGRGGEWKALVLFFVCFFFFGCTGSSLRCTSYSC